MNLVQSFLGGFVAALSLVIAAFFVRFYGSSKSALFPWFAAAFLLMAGNWAVLSFLPPEDETRPYLYFVRLASYLLIIGGIVLENRKKT